MNAHIIGKRIAKLRKMRNLTQQQLADELSVSNKTISKWETGGGLPDTAIIPSLAFALDVNVEDIISEHEPPVNRNAFVCKLRACLITRKAKVTAIVLSAVLIFAFAVCNVLWFRYVEIAFTPFLENKALADTDLRKAVGSAMNTGIGKTAM